MSEVDKEESVETSEVEAESDEGQTVEELVARVDVESEIMVIEESNGSEGATDTDLINS